MSNCSGYDFNPCYFLLFFLRRTNILNDDDSYTWFTTEHVKIMSESPFESYTNWTLDRMDQLQSDRR